MVMIKSSMYRSKQPLVNINVYGVADVMLKLRKLNIEVGNQAELALVRNANLVQQEVQESAIGNRAEPKSVDTGKFANSIEVDATQLKQGTIYIKSDVEYAKFLEWGTSTRAPRRHFKNSLDRKRNEVIDNMKKATGKAVKLSFGLV